MYRLPTASRSMHRPSLRFPIYSQKFSCGEGMMGGEKALFRRSGGLPILCGGNPSVVEETGPSSGA